MLATLVVMGLLAMGAIKGYHFIVNKIKAQNTAKMIKTLALERQNSAINIQTGSERTVKGPHSALHVVNGSAGNHEPYFWVETTLKDSDFCEALKESNLIQAEFIEVDKIRNGACTDNSKIAFYFKKDKGGSAYCPSNATNCDQYGDATGCEDGYYLDNGVCSACGEHVATCEDENTATSCETGYKLLWGACIEPKVCTTDLQCSICGECDVETGYCKEECVIPEPDANDNCGENECIIYDEDSQTCKNACTRVEYLESTGTQYIDTGYKPIPATTKFEFMFTPTSISTAKFLFGARPDSAATSANTCTAYSPNDRVRQDWAGRSTEFTLLLNTTDKFLYTALDNTISLNNETYVGTITRSTTRSDYNFMLFTVNTAGTADSRMLQAKLYYSKLWDDTALVRDFIPVLSPESSQYAGAPCMFDKVSKKLFCNAGTGEFKTNLDN